MNITGAEFMTWMATLLWPFMRIGAMFAAAPIFSARSVPVRIRILLSFFYRMDAGSYHTSTTCC